MADSINETTYEWDKLSDKQQSVVCIVVGLKFKTTDLETVKRVYELGKPKIVFADNLDYFRVHEDSQKLMVMLTKQYIL